YACLDPEKHEIRLLQVVKRVKDHGRESLLTRTFTISLLDPEHHPYKCLSYVWSDQTPMFQKGLLPSPEVEDASSPLAKLQQNALTALMELAEEDSVLTIWIDAISINQDDSNERSSQVAMMDLIYQNAEEVIAWISP
ncbi:HET-domain-containing protein, partial [Cucurbitaria berberidis CBS 394.84]